jgi:hypothetical protein
MVETQGIVKVFSRVERSAASGGRVVRVEASGIVLKTVR